LINARRPHLAVLRQVDHVPPPRGGLFRHSEPLVQWYLAYREHSIVFVVNGT
jgi:hypothetical protein